MLQLAIVMPTIEIARSGEPTPVSVGWVEGIHSHLWNIESDGIFPKHFLTSTFPRIGGRVIAFLHEGKTAAYGFAFPTKEANGEIVRGHWLIPNHKGVSLPENWYDPYQMASEGFSEELVIEKIPLTRELSAQNPYQGPFSMYRPNLKMAQDAQELQDTKWHPDNTTMLYPPSLYHPKAAAATRLVVVDKNKNVAGFLFGFYGRGNKWMGNPNGNSEYGPWIESQLMAVDDEVEGYGLGANLKWQQLKEAKEQRIKLVHWTYDPLLAGNAKLNLNTLGGIVAEFTPTYYPFFQNARNRVPASRFGVYWLVESKRTEVAKSRQLPKLHFEKLATRNNINIINPLIDNLDQKIAEWQTQSPDTILIQIPTDWQKLQDEAAKTGDSSLIESWRDKSDKLFERIIGRNEGKYIITAVTFDNNKTPFLVGIPFRLLVY